MKKGFPKISIVTPSYNQGKYLEQTIQSVLSQNYPNLDYVIIDGGSTDGSVEIIKKHTTKLTFWESKKDRGQWDAINKGFAKTSGEIMTWLNSDDVLMQGTLQLVANIFKKLPKVDWLTGIPTTINEQGFIMHVGIKPAYVQGFIEQGYYHGAGLGYIMQEGTFWRKKLWDESGGELDKENYLLDYKLWKNFAKYSQLVPVFTSLAAFRLTPKRKTENFNTYINEIGIQYPNLTKLAMLPIRGVLHFGVRKVGATSSIHFDKGKNKWLFKPGWGGQFNENETVVIPN